jgi:RNA 3'-terminal phosphate cyclase (ATP)
MITIDGSYGEGGGQILRTSLALSCLFRKPFTVTNIRKGRAKPGLMPQHLAGVRAARLVSGAAVRGDAVGSTELSFEPGEIRGGDYFYDIGTSGSTPLLLQTMIPALLLAKEKSVVTLLGGTHVPFSPPFHYLSMVFAPFLSRIGIDVSVAIDAYGFYPRGGGKIRAEIFPAREIRPFRETERGRLLEIAGYSVAGSLPLAVALRQKSAAENRIRAGMGDLSVPLEIEALNVPAPGPGTFLFLRAEYENVPAGFVSLGARGKRAETVGEEAAEELLRHHAVPGAFDPHMADQIVLYLALCPEESVFTASSVTSHLLTNLWVIERFHEDFRYLVEEEAGRPGRVVINPAEAREAPPPEAAS